MKAFECMYCISIPKSVVSTTHKTETTERSRTGNSVWWPCQVYPNYKALLSDLPSSNRRSKLFLLSLKNPDCPVASLYLSKETDEIVTVPFPTETSIEALLEKHLACDFIDWYMDEYMKEKGNRSHLDKAVSKAICAMEDSLSNEEMSPITVDTIKTNIVMVETSPLSSTSVIKQDITPAKANLGMTLSKEVIKSNKNNSSKKRKTSKNKRKETSVSITEMSHDSTDPGRTWGEATMSKNRVSARRVSTEAISTKRLKRQRRESVPKQTSSFITPHTNNAKSRAPDLQVQTSGKDSISSAQTDATPLEKLSWKHLWEELKSRGWNVEVARNPLDDWYYIRPGYNQLEGNLNEHYFKETADVMAYIKKEAQQAVGRNRNSIMKDMEQEQIENPAPASPAAQSISSDSYYIMSFKEAYQLLQRRLGFTYRSGKYVWPEVILSKKGVERGKHYFEGVDELKQGLRLNGIPDIEKLSRTESKLLNLWIHD